MKRSYILVVIVLLALLISNGCENEGSGASVTLVIPTNTQAPELAPSNGGENESSGASITPIIQTNTPAPELAPVLTSIKTIDPSAQAVAKSSTPATLSANSQQVLSITCQELKAKLDNSSSFLLLDVRSKGEFNAEHIDTAVSIPMIDLPNQLGILSHNLEIVVYSGCS